MKKRPEHVTPDLDSALTINEGVVQPPTVNVHSVAHFRNKIKRNKPASEYIAGILDGNRTLLSQAITLVESSRADHQAIAREIVEKCMPHSGKSFRIGITGVPGVGKSSFIESFGMHLTSIGRKVCVLAIDPSSEKSKGSILGDKTRMEQLSVNPDAFIRPSPSAGSLGGVARKTRETIILCEAAGFDTVFVETVGVGQSETVVHSMTDFFLLLMLAGAGDELQGIKRGIMEMADTMVITKADGTNVDKANQARVQYQNALHLFPKTESGWVPKVLTCSAHNNIGIPAIWDTMADYLNETKAINYLDTRRAQQAKYWMYESINESLLNDFYHQDQISQAIPAIEKQLHNRTLSSYEASRQLLELYRK